MKADGPPGATANGFNENQALFAGGKCAMWIDATSAAGRVYNKASPRSPTRSASPGADRGDAQRRGMVLVMGARHPDLDQEGGRGAKTFVRWATSKDYVKLVGETRGMGRRASRHAQVHL